MPNRFASEIVRLDSFGAALVGCVLVQHFRAFIWLNLCSKTAYFMDTNFDCCCGKEVLECLLLLPLTNTVTVPSLIR